MRTGKKSTAGYSPFWKYELPLIFRRHHRVFLFIAVSFLFVTIGYLSSAYNPEFVRGVLGDDCTDMTKNIASGIKFRFYKNSPFNMFMRIAFNNIRVSFLRSWADSHSGISPVARMEQWHYAGLFPVPVFSHGLGANPYW
ncbi:MAG: hypothetical protein U0T56_12690 [Ferruginibacter sp.]